MKRTYEAVELLEESVAPAEALAAVELETQLI